MAAGPCSHVESIDEVEVPVLIHPVNVVRSPEQETTWQPSLVWLFPLNYCTNLWADRCKDTLDSTRPLKAVSTREDRELRGVVGGVQFRFRGQILIRTARNLNQCFDGRRMLNCRFGG